MADIFRIGVTVQGLQEEVDRALSGIGAALPRALGEVARGMAEDLSRHIREDWYEPWGPPEVYKRRTDDPTRGTPLGSPANMDAVVSGGSLTFTYEPTGEYSIGEAHNADGDKLIKIIQEDEGWAWNVGKDKKKRYIFPRPFWDNFVREQAAHGIMDRFCAGMREAKDPFTVVPQGGALDVLGMEESLLSPQINPF